MNDKVKDLYDFLTNEGYDFMGSEDEFRGKLKDGAKAGELYSFLTNEGYDFMGTYDEFISKVGAPYNTAAANRAAGVDEASNRAQQAQQPTQRNMGTPGYVPNRFGIPTQQGMGPVADAAPHPMTPAQPQQSRRQYDYRPMQVSGSVQTPAADQPAYRPQAAPKPKQPTYQQAQQQQPIYNTQAETPAAPEFRNTQKMYSDAADKAWQKAEQDTKALREANTKKIEDIYNDEHSTLLGKMAMAQTRAAALPIEGMAASLKAHDMEKMANDAWGYVSDEDKEYLLDGFMREIMREAARSGGSGGTMSQEEAEKALREEAERRAKARQYQAMYDKAVAANAPKDVLDFLQRKIVEGNSLSKLAIAAARTIAGTRGDMDARAVATHDYGKGHRVADITGSVLQIATDPVTWAAGGAGKGAVKGATAIAERAAGAAATRRLAATKGGQLAQRIIGGSANFAAFEGLGDIVEQLQQGGVYNEETGQYEYSLKDVAKAAGHGVLLGGATGVVGGLVGNVGDKVFDRVASTAGKLAVRGGQTLTSIAAEGTIFAAPELISGEGDFDTWLESVEMMAGFKLQHGLKALPGTMGRLMRVPESRAGFETRLRDLLQGRPDLALTNDEREELERGGYTDLSELAEAYKGIEGKLVRMGDEMPYDRFSQLMADNSISEAARAKMYYYVTGRGMVQSTVTAAEIAEHRDHEGNITDYVVKSYNKDGGVITSRTYKSKKAAEVEFGRLTRQSELNSIDMLEKLYDRLPGTDATTAKMLRDVIGRESGIDIDKVIGKEENRRTDEEKAALQDYLNTMAKECQDAWDRQHVDVNQQRLQPDWQEAYDMGYNADEQQRSDISIEREDNPNDPQAQAAWQGVEDRIRQDAADRADQRRAEGEKMAYKGKGDMQGMLRPITINEESKEEVVNPQTGKKERKKKTVYLVNGNIAIEPNGSGLSREGTDKTIYVYDPETGEAHELDPFGGAGVLEVSEPVSMEDYLANNEQQSQAEVQQAAETAQGKVKVNTPFETPQGRKGVVQSIEGDNAIVLFADGEMEQASMPLAEVQQYADALRRQEYETRHPQESGTNGLNGANGEQAPTEAGQAPTPTAETQQEGGNADTRTPAQRTYDDVVAKLGADRASKKIDASAKVKSDRLKKAEKALKTAQETADNTEYGSKEEQKAEEAVVKAQAEYDAALADYNAWDEVRKLRDQALLAQAEQEEQQRKADNEARVAAERRAQEQREKMAEEERERQRVARQKAKETEAALAASATVGQHTTSEAVPEGRPAASKLAAAREELADDPEALSMLENLEPHTLDEVAAMMMASGSGLKLQMEDEEQGGVRMRGFRSATGLQRGDAKQFPFVFATRDKGGISIDEFGERVLEIARDEGVIFDENDAMAGVNAALEMFSRVRTQGDINDYILDNRIAAAQAYHERMQNEVAGRIREAYGMTEEEYDSYMSWLEDAIEQGKSTLSDEEFNQLFNIYEQGQETDAARGNQDGTETTERPESAETDTGQDGGRGNSETDAAEQAAVSKYEEAESAFFGFLEWTNWEYGTNYDWNSLMSFLKWANKKAKVKDQPLRKFVREWIGDKYPPKDAAELTDKIFAALKEREEAKKATAQAIAAAEAETDTNPTEGQKEAGNYKKGHVRIDGYDITIEQPKGSVRRGTDKNGRAWEQVMHNTYGYIRGTESVDGDHIDIFLSDEPTQGNVYVVDQVDPETGEFDEHKVMYGFPDMESARQAYLSNYEDGWRGLGTITPVSKEEFKKWIESSHRKTKPFSEYKRVKTEGDVMVGEGIKPESDRVETAQETAPTAQGTAQETTAEQPKSGRTRRTFKKGEKKSVEQLFEEEKAKYAGKESEGNEYAEVLAMSKTVEDAVSEFNRRADAALKEADDWRNRTYKPNNAIVEGQNGADEYTTTIGAANERRRESNIKRLETRARELHGYAETLKERTGYTPAAEQTEGTAEGETEQYISGYKPSKKVAEFEKESNRLAKQLSELEERRDRLSEQREAKRKEIKGLRGKKREEANAEITSLGESIARLNEEIDRAEDESYSANYVYYDARNAELYAHLEKLSKEKLEALAKQLEERLGEGTDALFDNDEYSAIINVLDEKSFEEQAETPKQEPKAEKEGEKREGGSEKTEKYRDGESIKDYTQRNGDYLTTREQYMKQKYGERYNDMANIMSGINAENAREKGRQIGALLETDGNGLDEAQALLSVFKVDAASTMPFFDGVVEGKAKESGKIADGLIEEMAAVDERERSLAGKPGYNEAYNAKAALADRIAEVAGDLPTKDLLRIHKEAKKRGMHAIEAHVEGELLKRREPLIKGAKWEKTGEPQPFKSRKGGKKGDSHDAYYKLGKKIYGLTTADSDSEAVLLEDYGNHVAIWNAYERGQVLLSPALAAAIKAKIAYNESKKQKADRAKPVTKKEARLRDAIVDLLRKAGIDVVTESEEGQRVLDMANGRGVTLNKAQKRTLETARLNQQEEGTKGTVVSSEDGAKVLKNLDILAESLEKITNRSKTFVGDVAKALGAKQLGSKSQYATFETKNGQTITIRLGNHNATVSSFDNNGEDNGISIVISRHENKGITNDGNAHLVEYFYSDKAINRAEGKPLADIVRSIKQALYSGEYKDTTGLAEREEVNAEQLRMHRVYHGSGADFERFDHSHMGEGEGAQAFGWGTYVTEVEGIGKKYANTSAGLSNIEYKGATGEEIYDRADESPEYDAASSVINSILRGMDVESAIDDAIKFHSQIGDKELVDEIRKLNPRDFVVGEARVLYTVEIPEDNGSNYLEWTKTIPKSDRRRIADAVRGLEGEPVQSVKYANYTGGWGQLADMIERNQWAFQEVRDRLLEALGGRIADDKKVSELMHSAGFVGVKYPADYYNGGRSDGAKNYVIFNESDLQITDKVKFFRTESGEAYGFTMGGKIYLDPKIATAETPIHEYTHLWAEALRQANPNAWEQLKSELEKDKDLMAYVQRLYPELKGDELMDEVFAHFSGRRGAERLRAEQERMEGETRSIVGKAKVIALFERLRNVLRDFWNRSRQLFAGRTKEVEKLGAEDFADMALADLLSGVNPRGETRKQETDRHKTAQLRAVVDANAMEDAYHTGIREIDDIKTFEEAVAEGEGIDAYPDFTEADARHAMKRGRITVYSSKPIENGTFVTPSKRNAQDYAGGGKVYSMEVPTEDVAWLDVNEGQYAKVKADTEADSDVRFRGEEEPVFYSNAMRAVENIKQERATPEQWAKMIEKQGGLKAGEDKWLGLSEWLKGSDAKTLTKGEVLDYIRANEIQVEEVEYGMDEYIADKVRDRWDSIIKEAERRLKDDGYNENEIGELDEEVWNNAIDKVIDDWFGKGWSQKIYYTLDGGVGLAVNHPQPINSTRLLYTTEGLDNKREIVLTVPTIEPWNEHDEVHFGEAGGGRAVAWVRFGETTDADGKRVLVIDEIQSKRHQEGREKGYKRDRKEFDAFIQQMADKYFEGRKPGLMYNLLKRVGTQEEVDRYKELSTEANRAGIPAAPFEKNWHEVAMKRMLRFAAENGYDKVAWTKGEQQAERYDLSDKVDEIKVTGGVDNTFTVTGIKDGETIVQKDAEGEKGLADLIGKDRARKAYSNLKEGKEDYLNEDGAVSFTGENLAIGGEGMKGFYDQILPRFMDKYGKRWGVKTDEVELPNIGDNGLTMWSVDVTDDMRESVMRGQPLFRPKTQSREGGEEAAQGDWYDRGSVERIGEFAGYSPQQIAAMNARQEESARRQFRDAAEKLHLSDNITFADTIDDVPGLTDKQREARRRKKGWYDPRTGKIVIILGNHRSMDDVMKSIMHEGVAHHGLRQLFGEHFNTFLDNVYRAASPEIRDRIYAMALNHGWDFRTATEEYLATLAEDTEFEKPENQSWWKQVKAWFIDLLHKIGFKLNDTYDTITDNELRYILWRSYENLVHPGRYNSVVEEAKDIAKQYDLKVGEWDETWRTEIPEEPNATMEYNGRRVPIWATNGRRGNRADRGNRTDRMGSDYNVAADGVAEDAAEYAKRDAEYMEAVENGDIEKAQRMVNEAAKRAMPDTKVVDKNGNPLVVYHGTKAKFNIFRQNPDDLGFHFGNKSTARNRVGRGKETKLVPAFIKLNNPIVFDEDLGAWEADYMVPNLYKRGIITEEEARSVMYTPTMHYKRNSREANRLLKELLIGKGYDGIIYNNYLESNGSLSYAVFSPSQIKSADPVTYDDNGNVLPLSQRFNEGNNDIRFRDGEDEETGAPKAQAREAYERMVSSAASQWKEAMQDSMLSLKKLYQAVSEATSGKSKKKGGYRIEDEKGYENAYLAENRMHSMNEAQIHAYQQDYMKPLQRAIHALTGGNREAYEELTDYMMAKHGLERNEVMAKRDAKKAWEEAHKDEQGSPNYEAARDAAFADIDAGVDELYLKYRKKDYAGLTALTGVKNVKQAEKEAQRMVDEYEQQHDTTDLWMATNRATRRSLFKMLECGLLSPERHADIRDMFQYYIPLQGFDSDVAEDVYAYMGSDGTAMYGTTIRAAKGRKSKADDPIATIAMNGEAAIRRGNRNLMKQHFLRFVQSHPSDLVSINDVWLRKNSNGEWEQYFDADLKETDTPEEVARKVREFNERMERDAAANPDLYKRSRDLPNVPFRVLNVRDMAQHQVMVQVDGKNYLLTINGNPRAAQALNGLTNPDVFTEGAFGTMMNATQSVVRTLSQLYTTRNPNFVLSNFLRDAVYTNSMVLAKESPNYAINFHKNFLLLPNERMGALFASWENGKLREKLANGTASNMEKMFYDFMMNGGETGWTSLRDIEKHKRDLQKALQREGNIAASALKKLGDFFDITNRMIENHARFTAYVTSIEMGRSVERAVWDAKEISVNFNKKGAGDKFLKAKNQTFVGKVGAFVSGLGRGNFAFWNASLQGLNNIARIGKRNPAKFMAVATPLLGLGVAIPLLNALLGGDDDDDKNAYWNLPEYVRRSNICFRFTKDMPWITIPLPIEFRAVYGLGELGSGVALDKEYYSNSDLAKQVAAQFSQVLPLDFMEGGGGWHCLYPTWIKPVIEAYSNQSWTGLPIYRKNTYGQYDVAPEWQRAYSNTNNQIMAATKWLNDATGGDEVQGGNIDFNPARIEYMLRGYLGGYFTVADQVIKMGETATGNRDFEWRNMMLANRVVKEGDERTEARKLTNEYFNLKEEYEKTDKSLKAYKKKQDEGTLSVVGQAHYIALMNDSEEYGRYLVFGTYKPLFEAYYKQIKEANAAGDSEEAKRLERGQNELRREMVNIIHDMENGGTFDRQKVATGINENLKKMQNNKLWDAKDKAIDKSIEAKNILNPTDNVEE